MSGPSNPKAFIRSVTKLGEVSDQLPALEIACDRCNRCAKIKTSRLLKHLGADMPLSDLLRLLSADCPRQRANRAYDACGAYFPGLTTERLQANPEAGLEGRRPMIIAAKLLTALAVAMLALLALHPGAVAAIGPLPLLAVIALALGGAVVLARAG